PIEYDIDGPYRIPKGRTIGLKAFEHKLEEKGHEPYYGYRGVTPGESGFLVSFFDAPAYPSGFCEITVWRNSGTGAIDSCGFVQRIARAIQVDYGYEHDHQRRSSGNLSAELPE